ncbi:hypothetical protein U1872_08030 [Sphingomonas sp. RB3P16]|uniref:hypothetical protein n=1 Tax=Parasphingomonas frigoris TaxID=3096163 RepID=UPI002FC5CAB6
MVEARYRIRLSPTGEDHRINRMHVLLRPAIPSRVDEIWLAPNPHGRVIFVAAEADEVQRWFHRRSDPFISRTAWIAYNIAPPAVSHLATIAGCRTMSDDEEDFEEAGQSWAEILERRSPEGRAVVLRLNQAEQAFIEAQRRVMGAMTAHRDYAEKYAAFEAAFDEVGRMRKEVYRMAHQ